MPLRPPYPPKTAAVGGVPTVPVDVPILAVFLFLYIMAAVSNMTILQVNLRKGHKFLMSGLLFGFCMARTLACIMRIVWACYPEDVQVAMASMILVQAGVLIIFIINLIFAQRIIRAAHPHFGWHGAIHYAFTVLYILVVLMLAAIITVIVQQFYTLNPNTHRIDRDVQLAVSSYFLFVAFLPIPMVIIGLVYPRKTRLEKFGSGRWRTKITLLLTTATLLTLGASFRAGTSYKNPRPLQDPAWYDAKWCFYIFNFTIEITVLYLYLLLRVDKRYWIPNGSKGPGDYTNSDEKDERLASRSSNRSIIESEEEFFDETSPSQQGEKDVEATE